MKNLATRSAVVPGSGCLLRTITSSGFDETVWLILGMENGIFCWKYCFVNEGGKFCGF